MGLLVVAAVAALEAVGLVGLKVGHRAHLEPALLCARPHLEVEGDGAREAGVAATQAQDVPGQLELLAQALHVGFHLLESGIAVFGLLDAHELYLVELVQAVEAAHVLAVAAGLAAEAGAVGAVLLGELVAGDDDVAVDVGGYISRRSRYLSRLPTVRATSETSSASPLSQVLCSPSNIRKMVRSMLMTRSSCLPVA